MSKLALLLAAVTAWIATTSAAPAEPIRGAGSTFAFPIIATWSQGFLRERAGGDDFVANDAGVDYEPVGSVGGMMRLVQPEIDFAATDAPLPPAELRQRGLVQFPIVIGGIAVAVNVPGAGTGRLRLTGPLLADIFLGKIRAWDDAAIRAANPELALPNLPIVIVHRSDGSGSTFTFTRYLTSVSEEWRTRVGADTRLSWPTGTGAEGSRGVVARIEQTPGAIGYVEYGQVVRAGVAFALIENRAGAFVAPEPANVQAAAASVDWASAQDFYAFLTDSPSPQAYPIAAATFVLMHREARSTARNRRVLFFLAFALERGRPEAAALGYVPLPDALVARVRSYWRDTLARAARF